MTLLEQIEEVVRIDWKPSTTAPTLQWSHTKPGEIISGSLELDRALHRIESRTSILRSIIVVLYAHGYQAGIGLGRAHSFVSIRSCDPGKSESCFITVGEAQPRRNAGFFFLNNRRTEIPQRNLIPIAQARQIIRQFLETGTRPETVAWEVL